jgi:protein-glutamine gamma-glutamyltransferase
MPTDFTFRLSTYLTLALSCVCLGYAEHDLLPEVPFIAAAVIVALIVLFRLEGRVELLSIPDANRLGLVVGLVNFVWLIFRMVRALNRDEEFEWQLLLVALFGPLLMCLMPAKLARREKHVGDYWGLHGAGLAAVALSAAMAEKPACFFLIGLYTITAIWSLTLFYIRRASGTVPGIPGQPAPPPLTGVVAATQPRSGFVAALGVIGLAGAVVMPMYMLTPPSEGGKLEFGKPRVEIGYAADQMIDLNRTGDLETNDQVAFEVTAEANGVPKNDLPLDQRWRGRVLRRYVAGIWQPGDRPMPGVDRIPANTVEWSVPRIDPGQITLKFTIPPGLRGQFLADPLVWAADEPPPVATTTSAGFYSWSWLGDGTFFWGVRRSESESLRYVQVWAKGKYPDASSPFRLNDLDPAERKRSILQNPVPRVKEYADAVILGLVRQGKLPPDWQDPITQLPRLEFHDHLAREFAAHLATDPELVYSTNLRRERKDLDPVEDFLFHTKVGHCERFATTLTLMLRSEGIPAVLILGFRGCETTDEPGKYVVRQGHAHAWVTALVPLPDQPRPRNAQDVQYHWLSLDPTPTGSGLPEDSGEVGVVEGTWATLRAIFNEYVVNFTAEQRRRALKALFAWLTRWDVLAFGLALLVGTLLIRRLVRRLPATPEPALPTFSDTPWFNRLLLLLEMYGFSVVTGQTLREFAAAVTDALRRSPQTAALAQVPLDLVEAYYEVRFGGTPLTPGQVGQLEAQFDSLQRALATPGEIQ